MVRSFADASEGTAEGSEALGVTDLDTTNIQRISERMRELEPIGPQYAEFWVRYWAKHGL
jgi:hypothetical protein